MKTSEEIELIARQLRFDIIKNSASSKTPHLGSCLSVVDILAALYFGVMDYDPSSPDHPDRDRFVLSKGHAAPALFFTLARAGFYDAKELESYGANGSLFGEHPPAPKKLAGLEAATGSLGHGLPISLGFATAARLRGASYSSFCVLGDGECNEGTIWEAAMFAAGKGLSNLCVVVDFNKWQATDRSCSVLRLDDLQEKWRAFGWEAMRVDGHSVGDLVSVLTDFKRGEFDRPLAIVADTVKGKGVSFMEDDNNWHYRTPSDDEVSLCQEELFGGAAREE